MSPTGPVTFAGDLPWVQETAATEKGRGGGGKPAPSPPKRESQPASPPLCTPKIPPPPSQSPPQGLGETIFLWLYVHRGTPKPGGGAHTSLKGVPQNGHHPHPRWGGASSQIWGCSLIVPCCKSAPPVDRFRGCPMLSGVKIWGAGAPPPSCQPGQRQVEPQGQGGRGPPPVPPSHWYQYGQGQHHPAPPQSPPQTPTSPPGGPRRHH